MINLHHYVIKVLLKCCWRTTMSWTLIRLKSSGRHPTAGIIVIGNEILKAQVKDTNCSYACNLLYKHGVKVQKIAVIRDDLEDIAKEIKYFSKMFNYVFTSGGIGPTHDDVTYEATALAFNDTLHYHPTLVDIIQNCFSCGTFPSPAYKMAYIPTKSVLKFGTNKVTGEKLAYPCVVIQNVYIFPGSPMFFETSFQALCKECFANYTSFAITEVYVNAREESFASALYEVTREYPNVTFGSYPESNRYYKARVTIESEDEKETEKAKEMFCDRIPTNVLIHYDRTPHVDCLSKYERLIGKFQHGSVYEGSFKKFVNYYKKPEEVWIYLDGSEESVIMIHLARIAGNKLRHCPKLKLHAICFKSDILTLDTNEFFHELKNRYNVELYDLENKDNDVALTIKHFAASKPQLRILLLGKRLNWKEREMYNNLARLSESTFVQVEFPLIDWTDEDVANFSSSLSLPYYTTKG
ncbi:PREDICTED: FAD synthase-like [Eufriesea mexicana]|uniref:FAD synthase-like n=1 Tax=Eufriesea mexicana TaxID=516756 RepID=UPI00083C5E52|nr:PREDICTED: FAD synthase-like [Eufriesea mexicana]